MLLHSPRRKLYACLAAAALAVGAGIIWYVYSFTRQPAPEITFSIIDGRRIPLRTLEGRPVMVQFWATTCSECRKEIPRLKTLYADLHPKGLEIVAVAMPYDPPNRVLSLAREAPLPYPVALDIDGSVTEAFGDVSLTPTTFLISPAGKIVFKKTGKLDFDRLRQQIRNLLSQQSQVTSLKSQESNISANV